jgi:hypothetical protein
VIACWAFALATAIGQLPSLCKSIQLSVKNYARWDNRGFNGTGDYLQARRESVREYLPQGETLYFLVPDDKALSSPQRSMHLAMMWEAMPDRVCYGGTNGISQASYIITSGYKDTLPVKDDTFIALRTNAHASIWARTSTIKSHQPRISATVPRWREILGLVAPCLVMLGGAVAGGWVGLVAGVLFFTLLMAIPPLFGFSPSALFVAGAVTCSVMGAWLATQRLRQADMPHQPLLSLNRPLILGVIALALFLVYAFLTLSHTFMTPNGLGVFGGKAKLLFVSAGIPAGFFTDHAWSTLQPAYPPGYALVTLGCYGLAGGCGEHLTQLLSCLFVACSLLFIGFKLPQRNPLFLPLLLWFAACLLAEQAIWTGILFYAEPCMLLILLVAVDAIIADVEGEEKPFLLPWILLGSCGWIKNEGILYLPAVWFAMRLMYGGKRIHLTTLIYGLILPVFWLLYSRFSGAKLYDFAPLWQPDGHQAWQAAKAVAKLAFLEPWRYGFAYPFALLILVFKSFRTGRVIIGLVVMLLTVLTFIYIFSLSRAAEFDWHLDSLERLLWLPAILMLFCFTTSSNLVFPKKPSKNSTRKQPPQSGQNSDKRV